jgi:predicted amidohydrolase
MERIKVAAVQTDIAFADREKNLQMMRERVAETAAAGASLTVFPECTTTGYCYQSLDEAILFAEPLTGSTVTEVTRICRELNTQVVFGLLEKDGERVFNTAVLTGPSGVIGSYRKLHLPHLGVDRFTTPGNRPLEVLRISELGGQPADLKIGLNICYDCSFPESTRVLMLQGVDLLILPTNWPPTSGLVADVIPSARALENHIYFMSVNRVGTERGISFIGKSKICDPSGRVLAAADTTEPAVLYAEVDPRRSRQKHLINIPGVHEVHRVNDRRPEMYGRLSEINRPD